MSKGNLKAKYYRYISFIKNTTNILKFKIMNIMLR